MDCGLLTFRRVCVCVCGFRLWVAGVPAATSWPELGPGSQAEERERRGTAGAVCLGGPWGQQGPGPVPVALGQVSQAPLQVWALTTGGRAGVAHCPPAASALRWAREPAHTWQSPSAQGRAVPTGCTPVSPSELPHTSVELKLYTWVLCTPPPPLVFKLPFLPWGQASLAPRTRCLPGPRQPDGPAPGSGHKGTPLGAVLSHSARGSASSGLAAAPPSRAQACVQEPLPRPARRCLCCLRSAVSVSPQTLSPRCLPRGGTDPGRLSLSHLLSE